MTQYTKEFREQAILLSNEIGVKKAAEQLGVVYSTLVDWRKKRNTMRKKKTKCIFGAVNRTRKAADERNCRTEGSK
ncbi:MAG: transposase [Treponema sp.]|nr:transposase [Treponema sp.]MDY5837735.1 transposase [Treponema sp.]